MLREEVIINTATGDLQGFLFIGHDGLPELEMAERRHLAIHTDIYRPATFPAAWELRQIEGEDAGILQRSWWDIGGVRARIVHYEREADDEERDTVRERAIETRIEEELDVRP